MNLKRRILIIGVVLVLLMPQAMACAPQPTPEQPLIVAQPTSTPTPPEPTATPVPPSPTPTVFKVGGVARQTEIYALWFAQGIKGPYGGTSRVLVSVEPNPAREVRVGFYEEEVGGSGPMWRASGWMAAILGSFLLGNQMVSHRYTFDVGGSIDGPSAGCLMTVGVLASLLGDEVNPEATMTGTINPDGTVGPVGGIPQKLEGAVDAGKRLILVPVGSRYSYDAATNAYVDVVEYGERLGAKVKEVADVYEAYQLLTGRPLPRPKGSIDTRPELPSAAFNKAQAKVKEWLSRYTEERSRYDALPDQVKIDELKGFIATAEGYAGRANNAFKQGLMASGYNHAVNAALYASLAHQTAKVLETLGLSGLQGVVNYLTSLAAVDTRIDALLDRLRVEKPRSLDDVLALGEAYGNLTIAMGLTALADDAVRQAQKAETEEQLYQAVFVAALYYALADHAVEMAEDALEVGIGFGTLPPPKEEDVEVLAEVLRRAADANINYFDSVVLANLAQTYGMHPETFKRSFMNAEMSYTFALASLNTLPYIKDKIGPVASSGYAVLGASLASFQLSSMLIAKYYSLGAQVDQTGNVTSVKNEKALMEMFDFIERRARENIHVAATVGGVPVLAILQYEAGRALREGNTDEKLSALQSFWLSSLEAQILAMLSGKMELEFK